MRIDFYGLAFETPRVTFYLWSPWRAAAIEHRMFEAIRALPGAHVEEASDELRVPLTDAKSFRTAVQSVARGLQGGEEGGDPRPEGGPWRWRLGGDAHTGEPTALWGFLRLARDRGGPGEPEKGEDIELEGFGLQIEGVKG